MGRFVNLTGRRFGRLTVIERYGHDKYNKILYRCLCDCGNEKVVLGRSLLNGKCKSCGCLNLVVKKEKSKYRGLAQEESRLYHIWKGMRSRCLNQNNNSYDDYGGRGIDVCPEWADDASGFETFVSWARSHGYSSNLSIDRINNNRGYYPDNCRWADWNIQANNRRRPKMITNQYGVWPYRNMPLPTPPKEDINHVG